MELSGKEKLKVIAICVLLVEALIGGLLPLGVWKLRTKGPWLSAAHGFSGGVILSVALLDMIADSLEEQEQATGRVYPFWSVFALLGVMLLLLLEYVVVPSYTPSTSTKLQQSLVAVAALSLHSFLEGLAVGIQDTVQQVRTLFIGVASHKLIAGLALGIKLATSGISRTMTALVMFVFAVMSPVGIAIGLSLTGINDWLEFVLQTLAAGTFLYVGIAESLHLGETITNEFSSSESQLGHIQFTNEKQTGCNSSAPTEDREHILLADVTPEQAEGQTPAAASPSKPGRAFLMKRLPQMTFGIGCALIALSVVFDD